MYILSATLSIIIGIFLLSRMNYQRGIYNENGVISITGTRCFLALLVMVSHATHYLYTRKNEWIFGANFKLKFGINNFFATSGKLGVLIFFMISGFLFYRVIYKENVDLKEIIKKRIKRIIPAYWASMIMIIAIGSIYFKTEFNAKFFTDLLRWATFTGNYQIGEINTSKFNSGVDWTLKIEWLLYLSIIPLSLFTRKMSYTKKDLFILSSIGMILIIALLIRLYGHIYTDPRPILGFASGLLSFRAGDRIKKFNNSKLASFVAMALVFIGLLSCVYAGYYLILLICCTVYFMIISSGNDLYGILANKTIVSLGEASYSLYLFHGIVIFILTLLAGNKFDDYSENILYCTAFNTLVIILSALISKVSYLSIEKRFYK